MSIAVIIPAYNEENSIGYVLDAVSQVKQTYDILTDIVVVRRLYRQDGGNSMVLRSTGYRTASEYGQKPCNESRP